MILADRRTYVGLLRAHGLREQGPATRLRLSHLLGATDLAPVGMPPGATLFVRRLSDPLPGRLTPDFGRGAVASRDWERAARSALTDCYYKAARPSEGETAQNAHTVIFADSGELLACLARDLASGVAGSRWWWATLLQALPSDGVAALVAAFCREARFVPAALANLSARGEAAAVLRRLTPADAHIVFEAVVHAFDLVWLASKLTPGTLRPMIEQPVPAERDRHQTTGQAPHSEPQREPVASPPPWEPFVPRHLVPESLSTEARALLGLCLLLHRAPAVACQRQFTDDFAKWHSAIAPPNREALRAAGLGPSGVIGEAGHGAQTEQEAPAPRPTGDAARPSAESTGGARTYPGTDAFAAGPHPGSGGLEPAAVESRAVSATEQPRRGPGPPRQPTSRAIPPAAESPQHEGQQPSVVSPPSVHQPQEKLPQEPIVPGRTEGGPEKQPAPESSAVHQQGFNTELGGVLFLINLMRGLGVPRDLETDFGIAYGLGAWGWLELLARCLLDRGSPELADDPIWKSLAELDGRRAGTPPPEDFVGQPGYRVPEAWLSYPGARTAGPLELRRVGLFWQLWDPTGYQVVEAAAGLPTGPASQGPVVPMAAEAEQRAERRSACRPLGWSLPQELKRFLKFSLPYIRWRLTSDMGLEETTGELAATLLLRRAQLNVTPTHVDLTMPLHLASGSVRCAGLDVDPGWVREFGRIVSFHYV